MYGADKVAHGRLLVDRADHTAIVRDPPIAGTSRRLAAILAADVAGYSRLMGADEEGTLARLKAHRGDLVDPKIAEHRGRIVKTTGDGLLVEFASVVDAVRCGAEIQRGMLDRDRDVPDDQRIRFRIGVNLGDIIVDGGDIFGDGVNVAARLEALAEPGGVCISHTVRDQIHDKLPYALDDLGEQFVKNIARPVRAYALSPDAVAALPAARVRRAAPRHDRTRLAVISAAVAAALVIAGVVWWVWPVPRYPPAGTPAAALAPQPVPRLSIVVLPFTNLSDDRGQQYFADGITDDLTTDLSRIENAFVISRNTAFTYMDKPVDAKQIGRELGVRYVLEGSVRRSGDQIRVNAQLIDAETAAHIWAERFDRTAGNLFTLQDEITSRIAVALDLELVAAEAGRPTEHPDARDYIFRGYAVASRPPTRENYAEAIRLFECALVLDPGSAEAQGALAVVLVGRVVDEMTDTATADVARAEDLIARALAASPRGLAAHYAKSNLLRHMGRCEAAITEYEKVIELDRNEPGAHANLGWCKLLTGSIEEAIPALEQALRLSPRDTRVGNWSARIGLVHLLQSRTDEAILWLEKGRSASPALPYVYGWLASAYALKGATQRAALELAEARRLRGEGSYASIARLRADWINAGPNIRTLLEATFFAGLRKAGVPEE